MTGKGYYETFTISSEGDSHVIHGGSYSIPVSNVDFVTWKKNLETGEFWVKLHTMSCKEIRLRVNFNELNEILKITGNTLEEYKKGDDDYGNMEY